MTSFIDRLNPEVTTVALCWRVARADGITLGFTTHDRTLDLDGLSYDPVPGMVPSAITSSDGLDIDTMEIGGALNAVTITAADLAAGRYDGAAVSVFMVDWTMTDAGRQDLARGSLGQVEQRLDVVGGSFTAELLGATAVLDATVVDTCSPECRAELGDTRCRVDLAPLTTRTRVSSLSMGDAVAVAGAGDLTRFVDGRLRIVEGLHAGIDMRVAAAESDRLILLEPLPGPIASGTRIELREGCDKRVATCIARFGNAANFRGEPHVPGGDLLTRFPGA